MNYIQLIRMAAISHANLLDEAKENARQLGGCDHSVGICQCELSRRIETGEKIQKELAAKANKLSNL